MGGKRGQVTIFIIVGIVIVVGVLLYFAFRDNFVSNDIPANLEPVYSTVLSCLETDVYTGISVLESQGGYIELPEYEPGSPYMPFSSQLFFAGNYIPYWYYVSGSNVQKEQVPTKNEMEQALSDFVSDRLNKCDLTIYYEQGFEVVMGDATADSRINDDSVEVQVRMPIEITKAEETAVINNHIVQVDSSLGELYEDALDIYEYEQENLFLEEYGVDVLRTYAPVDGVEITCSPVVIDSEDVFDELELALESNTNALRSSSSNYRLSNEYNKYFVVDLPTDKEVRFLNSRNWAHSFEVNPSEGSMLISMPVGNQPGMGILGFCYAPYHYIYDINYPVMVQVQDGIEIFQFPLAIVIKGNMPREPYGNPEAYGMNVPEICDKKITPIYVETIDYSGYPVDAEVYYECLGARCLLGESESGVLETKAPECTNGFVSAQAEGFVKGSVMTSTTESSSVEVYLRRMQELDLDLFMDGAPYSDEAYIMFISEDITTTVQYPETRSVDLAMGDYEVQVYIYKDSSLVLPATNSRQCTEVPQSGLGGLFGFTNEQCFDIEIPSQEVQNALAGGGIEQYFITDSELFGGSKIQINAPSLDTPTKIEDLQENYIQFERNDLDIQII